MAILELDVFFLQVVINNKKKWGFQSLKNVAP